MAVREAHGLAFGEYGHLVDRKNHAAFCLDAYEGGIIGDDALDWLTAYPNDYGLYMVTQEVVEAVESRLSFSKTGLIRGVKRRSKLLGTPAYELQPAAQKAMACIEAGLFPADAVADLVVMGPDCAYHLIQKVEQTLIDVASADCPEMQKWLAMEVYGESFNVSAQMLQRFDLPLPPADCEDFQEVRVFLFKALDAMSSFLIHFHTPSTFMGIHSYDLNGYSDAYGEMKDRVRSSTLDELTTYLMETPIAQLPFETWALGFDDDENRDESVVANAAYLLKEMDQLTQDTHFTLNYGQGVNQSAEIKELIAQVEDSISAGSKFSTVLSVIKDAFEVCLQHAVNKDHATSEHELTGSAEEGCGLFETLVVFVKDEYEALEEEALNSFDERVQGMCDLYISLPLDQELLSQVSVPILSKTQQCFALLKRITKSLEDLEHAQ
ncbi:hypothetical protein HKW90_05085 [Pseudomonas aeruginosa]|nr:hypothetical protein [Pseudomonas aeruginosa]